jgi:hypothetical protein
VLSANVPYVASSAAESAGNLPIPGRWSVVAAAWELGGGSGVSKPYPLSILGGMTHKCPWACCPAEQACLPWKASRPRKAFAYAAVGTDSPEAAIPGRRGGALDERKTG